MTLYKAQERTIHGVTIGEVRCNDKLVARVETLQQAEAIVEHLRVQIEHGEQCQENALKVLELTRTLVSVGPASGGTELVSKAKGSGIYVTSFLVMLFIVAPMSGSFFAYHGYPWWWSGFMMPMMFWGGASFVWNEYKKDLKRKKQEKD